MTLPHAAATFGGLSETHASSAVPEISTVILNGGGSSVSEGGTATFNVSTQNIPDSTSLTWTVVHGTTASADFTSTTGSVTITGNSGSFGVPTVADNTTEGNETFTVSVTGNVSGTPVSKTSTSITILDTSQDPNTPSISMVTSSETVIYEGGVATTITLATSDIPNGTTLNWEIVHQSGSANDGGGAGTKTVNADFTASSGTVTINSDAGSFNISAVDDSTRNVGTRQYEADNFNIRIYGTVGSTSIDNTVTSICGIRDETPYIHNIIVPTSIDEGSSANITVEHYDIPTGTTLNWQLIGSGGSPIDSNDFPSLTGTVNSGGDGGSLTLDDTTIINITPTSDNVTEGAESAIIRVSGTANGVSFTRDSSSFTINDTSTTPPSVDSVTGPSTVNEGSSATINVSTTNIPDGTTLAFTVNHGTSSSADMNVSSGNVTINSNAGSFALNMTADSTTEGSETFTVTVSGTVNSTAVSATSNTITINDTSTTPASPAITAVTPASTTINEGSSLVVTYSHVNIPQSTPLVASINHISTSSSDFGDASNRNITTGSSSPSQILPNFGIAADATTEGGEEFTITVSGTVSGTPVSATSPVITINDTSTTPAPTYSVTAPASINEGATGSMSVTTTNVSDGTTLYWTVTPSADFGTSSGSFSVSSNSGSFTVSPTADSTTEGAETGTIAIRTDSTSGTVVATDTFTINDTSTTPVPTYSINAPSSIDEGSSGTFNVTTTNVSDGTVLYFTMDLTGDFVSPQGTVSINSNAGSFSRTPTADSTTEGAETCTVSLRTGSTSGTVVATDTFTINDTSTTAPTYAVTAPTTINEGSAGTMNVTTTDVANGTTLYYTVLPSADFSTSSGSFSITSNAGSFTVTPTADSTTEGTETGTIEIRTGSTAGTIVATDTFNIGDTSTTPPTYAVTAPASIDEGSTGTVNVSTTNVSDGTDLYWSVGTGDTPADFDSPSSGTVTITSNAGSFTVTPTADSTTEGSETATVTLRVGNAGGTIVATDTFTINDTSTTPAPTYSVTSPVYIDEGSAGTINVTTTNVTDGTTLYYTMNGVPSGATADNSDFSGGFPTGSFTINSNAGSFTVTPLADSTTEGQQTCEVKIRTGSTGGTIVASGTVYINDTSTTPPTYAVTAPASIDEGSSGTINVTTTDVSDGTTLYYTVQGIPMNTNNASGDDFDENGSSFPSGSFTINSNAGSFTVTATADLTTEGQEAAQVDIRTGSTSGTIVATDTFNLNDTSTTPAPTYAVTAPTSIDEGSAGTINVTTTNVPNGSTLYWVVSPSGDFSTSSGSFSVTSNAASFTITPTADSTTEGAETGTITIKTGSTSGTTVATDTFTINDTSTAPAGASLSIASNFVVSSSQTNDTVTCTATGLGTTGPYNLSTPNPNATSGSLLCEFNSFFHSMSHSGGGTWTVNVRLDRTGATVGTGTSTFEVRLGFNSLSPAVTATAGVIQNS